MSSLRVWRWFVCVVLICTASHAAALHADEQGLRDWVNRYVGDVHEAAVLPPPLSSSSTKLLAGGGDEGGSETSALPVIVVASRDGAVAALPSFAQSVVNASNNNNNVSKSGSNSNNSSNSSSYNGTTAMLWREVFSEVPRCVTTTAQVVVAVSAQGTVTVMNAETGSVDVTFALELPQTSDSNNNNDTVAAAAAAMPAAADAVACAAHADGTHVAVVLVAGQTAYVYDVDVDASVERIAPSHTLPLAAADGSNSDDAKDKRDGSAAVRDVRLSPHGQLWVNTRDGAATLYDVARGTRVRRVSGYCTDVDVTGAALVLTPSAIHVHKNSSDSEESVPCVECSAVLLRHVRSADGDDDDEDDDEEGSKRSHTRNSSAAARRGGIVYARVQQSADTDDGAHDVVAVTFASGRVQHVPTYAAVGHAHVLLAYTQDDAAAAAKPSEQAHATQDDDDDEEKGTHGGAARLADEVALLRTAAHDLVLVSASRGVLWWRAEGLVHAPATLLLTDLLAASGAATTRTTTTTKAAAAAAAEQADMVDHLHFHKIAYVASRHGVLYRVPLAHMGRRVDALVDFVAPALAQLRGTAAAAMASVTRDEVVVRDMRYVDAAEAEVAVAAAAAATLDKSAEQRDNNSTATRASVPLLRVRATAPGDVTLLIDVDVRARRVQHVTQLRDVLVVSPTLLLQQQQRTAGDDDAVTTAPLTPRLLTPAPATETFTYVVNVTAGSLTGYRIQRTATTSSSSSTSNSSSNSSSNDGDVTMLWTLQLPQPIVAYASGQQAPGRTDVVNQLHIYPNRTSEEPVDVVLHRYALHNVLAVAYYETADEELPTLVVVVVDTITGSVLATTRHRNVEGAVHMVVVEHAIVYYFLDAQRMRYCFGVLELFEQRAATVTRRDGVTLPQIVASFFVRRTRTVSSRASRPPLVVVAVLGAYGGPLADLSVTTSRGAIARKSLVLAYATGRVALIELRQLLAGGQMPMPGYKDRTVTHVIVPSVALATHRYRLAQPQRIATAPTALESSAHVLVTGMDVFYVRASSSGKPFDVLNSDFNKPLLITLFSVFAALSLLARFLVQRKGVHVLWQ